MRDDDLFHTASLDSFGIEAPPGVSGTVHVIFNKNSKLSHLDIHFYWANKTGPIGWVAMPPSSTKRIERSIEYMATRNRLGLPYEANIDERNYNDCVRNKRA